MTPNPPTQARRRIAAVHTLFALASLILLVGAPLAAAPGAPIHISHKEFKSAVLRSDVPVVVDFWAAWCGPCRKIAPALETLAAANAGRLVVAKVNVDENLAFTHRYRVKGLPTLLVFKNGREVGRLQGNRDAAALEGELAALVGVPLATALVADATPAP